MDLTNLNQNPELAAWLESLKTKVAAKESKGNGGSKFERKVTLPVIDMSKKFYQNNGKTYPEMQGTINLLPVTYKGERITEINKVLKTWCPANDEWSYGFMYDILPPEYYPEGPVRDRIASIRSRYNTLLNSGKISWKECRTKTYSVILGYVIMHRNTKGDLISSNLYGGDEIVEHKNFPAVIKLPNGKVQTAVQTDLSMKPNAVPYAMGCYSDVPLIERKGWMSIKFVDTSKGFGYDVSVNTELLNPAIMPEGILPSDFNPEDERVKLLDTTDPIYSILDWHQRGPNGEYYTEESLNRLEAALKFLESK